MKDDLIEILKKYKLEDGIKEHFVKENKDYFDQAVIIVANLPLHLQERLMYQIDEMFQTYGYKPSEFISHVIRYTKELDDLYKEFRTVSQKEEVNKHDKSHR